MKIPFTSRIADISSLLIFIVVVYTSQPAEQPETAAAPSKSKHIPTTIASLAIPSDEAYFDLIVETSGCLGENLWIGGKVECITAATEKKAGKPTNRRHFAVKELTATGLSTYSSYKLRNQNGTLKAIGDNKGQVFLLLQEGQMQLQPTTGEAPIIVAYEPNPPEGYQEDGTGRWSCE